jgi:predicted nucleic acid-binding protein
VRVVVDTSVWSLALRRHGPADHPAVSRLQAFLSSGEDLFLTGMILQEILQAFRSETMAAQIAEYLEPFPLLPIEPDVCLAAARLFRQCREHGLGVSTIDCHIAASAIENRCQLLTTDRDFERMVRISQLQLA